MKQANTRLTTRLAAVLATLALSAGAVACGSDDDGGDGGTKQQSAAASTGGGGSGQTRSGGDPDGTPEQRIKAQYDALVDDLYAHDARAVCAVLSQRAIDRMRSKTGCRETFADYFEKSGSGFIADRPRVVSLKIAGRRALARAKTTNSNSYSIPFVKVDGQWKVDGGFETAGL